MGLFDKIFGNKKQIAVPLSDWKTLTAYTPVFRSWSGSIYESELVRSAINARATHISKLKVEVIGSARPKLQTRLTKAPNDFQTWSQFLYRLSTILDVQNTAFIVPVLDKYGDVTGVYPLLPSSCELKSYKDTPYLRYMMRTGEYAAIELSKCGIMNKFQYDDDFFGSNNAALRSTMELLNLQRQAIKEGVQSSATYRFMAQVSNFTKTEDLAKERKRFTKENLAADSEGGGLLLFPNTYQNIQQINSKPFVVDTAQMQLISTNVYNYFGVNEDILQSKAVGDKWAAFYEGVCESFAIQFSEVMTKMLFTNVEIAYGSQIVCTANRIQYMSTADKINYVQNMGDRGYLTINEAREVFNLPPLPPEEGNQRPIRGEFYDASQGMKLKTPDEDTTDNTTEEEDSTDGN